MRAGAFRPQRDARALAQHVLDGADLERIAGRQQEPLLAAAERHHHRILQIAAARHGGDIGVFLDVFERMQVHGGGDGFAGAEPVEAGLAADGETGEAGAAFAQGPFQQRVVAATDDRCNFGARHAGGPRDAGGQPLVELGLGKQPAAGDLGAGHGALGHHFVDFTLLEAEIGGGFGGREKLHGPGLRCYAYFLRMANNSKITRAFAGYSLTL